jgi:hypothetical protein
MKVRVRDSEPFQPAPELCFKQMDVRLAAVRFREGPSSPPFQAQKQVKDDVVHGNYSLFLSLRLPEVLRSDRNPAVLEIHAVLFEVDQLSYPLHQRGLENLGIIPGRSHHRQALAELLVVR